MSFGAPNPPYGQQPPGPQYGGQPGYGAQPGYGGQPGYGYPQTPGLPGNIELASMGRRLAARVIDWVAVGIVYGILIAIGITGTVSTVKDATAACDANSPTYQQCLQDNLQSNGAGSLFAALATAFAVIGLTTLFYEWLMVSFLGGTLGKLALGVRVVKEATGEKPGAGPGFLRWIIQAVGGFLCGIGTLLVYLSPFWDSADRNRGWHDRVAGTLVIRKPGS